MTDTFTTPQQSPAGGFVVRPPAAARPAAVPTLEPLPGGLYDVVVVRCDERTSQQGNPMLRLALEVEDGEHRGRWLWDNLVLVERAMWKLVLVVEAITGRPCPPGGITLEARPPGGAPRGRRGRREGMERRTPQRDPWLARRHSGPDPTGLPHRRPDRRRHPLLTQPPRQLGVQLAGKAFNRGTWTMIDGITLVDAHLHPPRLDTVKMSGDHGRAASARPSIRSTAPTAPSTPPASTSTWPAKASTSPSCCASTARW